MTQPPYAPGPGEEQDGPRYQPYTAPQPGYQPPSAPMEGMPYQQGGHVQGGYAQGGYVQGGYGPSGPYQEYSSQSKVAAGLLQLLLPLVGIPGVGRLYAGHTAIGLVQLLGAVASYVLLCAFIGFVTLPAVLLWSLVDGIVMLASSNLRDGSGRLMR